MNVATPAVPIADLTWRLRTGALSASELVEVSRRRSRTPEAEATIITSTYELARTAAVRSDRRRGAHRCLSPLDGVPVVWKDLFDVAGTVTTAGSATRIDAAPETRDSTMVRRAHAVGLVTVGKTNLSELAFSGLGVNQHFGTPINPAGSLLVPGGSSSGSAVAVALGIAPLGIGTDTSGSVRVPAAFCGVVGFRATRGRYGTHDFRPLAPTLDSVGVLARSVADIQALDSVLAVRRHRPTQERPHFVVPCGELLERCTPQVRDQFESAVEAIQEAGWQVTRAHLPALEMAQTMLDEHGTVVGYEAAQRHGHLLVDTAPIEDATRRRLEQSLALGPELSRVYTVMPGLRAQLRNELAGQVLLCPTVAHTPPHTAALLQSERVYDRMNASTLRTTMLLSYLGTCGISLPLFNESGFSTVGLLLSLPEGHDDSLLVIAKLTEAALRQ